MSRQTIGLFRLIFLLKLMTYGQKKVNLIFKQKLSDVCEFIFVNIVVKKVALKRHLFHTYKF